MVAWAETDAMARDRPPHPGRARSLLQQAVKDDPRNQRGLWLLGISDYQRGHSPMPRLTWRRLQVLLQPGSKVAQAVKQQIAMANARAGGKTQATGHGAAAAASRSRQRPPGPPLPAMPRARIIAVHVQPGTRRCARRSSPTTRCIVFARASKGPPMPLAVARLKASALPTTVMLTDGMGMTPPCACPAWPRSC